MQTSYLSASSSASVASIERIRCLSHAEYYIEFYVNATWPEAVDALFVHASSTLDTRDPWRSRCIPVAEISWDRAKLGDRRLSDILITMAERSVSREGDAILTSNMSSNMSVLVFENSSGRSRSVKRPRPVKSCTECRFVTIINTSRPAELTAENRKRKLKCDRLCPCSQCQKSQRVCTYSPSDHDGGNTSDVSEAETPERPSKRPSRPSVAPAGDTPVYMQLNGPASSSFGNSNSVPTEDMSTRLERLERLMVDRYTPTAEQKLPRRQHYSHVPAPAVTIRALSVKGGLRTRFFGQNSTKVLLNLVSVLHAHGEASWRRR